MRALASQETLTLRIIAASAGVSSALTGSDTLLIEDTSFSTAFLPRSKVAASVLKMRQNEEAVRELPEKLEWSWKSRVSVRLVASAPITSTARV
jgi:transketolase C-terminal domain/subunit